MVARQEIPIHPSVAVRYSYFDKGDLYNAGPGLHSREQRRALADAEMTAHLWLAMSEDLRSQYGFDEVPFSLMRALAKVPKKQARAFLLSQMRAEQGL